jgi:beta-phosphoglucomutase-like phosphatase (HAD superfamily)
VSVIGIIGSAHYRIPTVKIRAVIFDFDGVIANSEPLHFQALRDVLAAEGLALSEHDYYARYLGFDDVAALEAIGADSGAFGPEHVASLASRKAVRFEELEADGPVLFPGAADAVRRTASLVPIGIASGARREEIIRVLEGFALAGLFAAIVGAEDVPHSKPDPAPYVQAVRLVAASAAGAAIRAADCVAIEDSHWGIESARAAGLRTVAVTHTYEPSQLAGADLIVDSLDAIDVESLSRQLA